MYVPELDMAVYTLDLIAVVAPAINFRRPVEESLDTSSSVTSFGNIRCEAEDSSCRLRPEDDGAETQEELKPELKG